ncbi:hypothetical protein J2X46_000017 [Nocardioides sp. BE266]|uniref:hypothetical protein n=1 Tax=Nocardioides sp. BE266 TaxID=2817725 RepID=UPI002865975D|nr:hypothetical protein [Nocardioides sp. BE266]MDR7251045.1 hypothetical protein [Nocardioides sp. BE266]
MRTLLLTTVLALSLAGCAGSEPEADDEPTSAATTAVDEGTAPGTDLAYGDSATLVWKPTSELTGELELSVDAVAEQRRSVFDGWTTDEAMETARPYFVTVRVTNAGESDLGGQVVPLYLRDDRGTLGAPWTLGGDFTACQSGPLPAPFASGESAELCLVYLAPDGAKVEDLVFEPTEGYDPISWTGDVATPAKQKPRTGRKRG